MCVCVCVCIHTHPPTHSKRFLACQVWKETVCAVQLSEQFHIYIYI